MAAANNAEWCDLVCGTHGAQTRFDEDAWTSRTRTPPGYPDAVTLVPDPHINDLDRLPVAVAERAGARNPSGLHLPDAAVTVEPLTHQIARHRRRRGRTISEKHVRQMVTERFTHD
jgi:hypothetical protein